jgi:nicotinamidase-related amidase
MQTLELDPKTTALISIDLEHGIVSLPVAPHTAKDVIERTRRLADALRAKGGAIIFVHVALNESLQLPVDTPLSGDPNAPPPPANASELVPEIGLQPGDHVVKKRQWGAFYGTEIEQLLHRKGIKTIIMSGIATNIGVESTARAAHDRGYHLVFVEDAMTSLAKEMHDFPIKTVFPRMGRVRTTNEVLTALSSS